MLSNLHIVFFLLTLYATSGIPSVAHIIIHNLHNLRRQNPLLQLPFYKWQSMTRLAKSYYYYSYSRGISFSESFHRYKEGEIPTRKGRRPVLRTNTKPQQLIKHTKISYSIASLVFYKFSCITYQNGLNRGTSKPRYSRYLKKYELC